jgi:pyruvate dehydrogenase E2 component (dihydrolipoamide acetyltransferase)
MPTNVLLPQWGMNMQEGTLLKWLKQEGEAVEEGEPLVEVETSKINSELEAPASGVLARILVSEGATVDVGSLLAIILAPGEELPPPPPQAQPDAAPVARHVQPQAASASTSGVQVVPTARRLAQQEGIDLDAIHGSGPAGRIVLEDVQSAIAAGIQSTSPGATLSGIRKTIAERMLHSVQTMAQVTLTTEADVTEMVKLRRKLVGIWRQHRLRPMDLDLVVAAVARALQDHRHLNATLSGEEMRLQEEINIGVAMAQDQGIIVPVLHRADEMSLLEIAQTLRVVANKARDGNLSANEVAGASFTITSLASFDIDAFTPIIDPPQIAILGVGRIVEKPAVYEGEITARSMMYLSLTFDHRATDGVPVGRFLQAIKRNLEKPG